MKITQLEQSAFIIETNAGYKLAVDVGSYTPSEKLDGVSVDAMLVSHIHGDHFSIPHIQKLNPKKLYLNEECIEAIGEEQISSEIVQVKVGDTVNIEDITVQLFDVDHGPNIKLRPRENFGCVIKVDGQTIYFAGDMFYPSGIDVSDLEVDIALIPVGTFYTFGPQEALAFSKQFKKIGKILPMHYVKTPETREEFIKLAVDAGFNTESTIL
ncbi:MAG: hypothetical protein RL094_730 [Candidatus Parcubacteria bacterium]|jgi:L-ascorbate metabolism protein UlaG (beta-lactamase superfamily)